MPKQVTYQNPVVHKVKTMKKGRKERVHQAGDLVGEERGQGMGRGERGSKVKCILYMYEIIKDKYQ